MSDQFFVGDIQTIVIPSPAVGNDFGYTMPSGRRLHIHGIAFLFITDANVANRRVSIRVEDPQGGNKYLSVIDAVQATNLTVDYSFADGNRSMTAIANGYLTTSLASKMILTPGDILHSYIDGIQVGDEMSEIYMLVESFLLP